ncbi:L-threonylcarbamoyladenylate synthase [Patescibacteria group bacterium]
MNYEKALQVLKCGGTIVFPCDTVMGIGASMNQAAAIEKLYKIKRRSKSQATAILVSDISMAKSLMAKKPDEFLIGVMRKHWPGALTIVIEASEIVPREILGGTEYVGIRMPDFPKLQKLIKELGCPLVATSANFKDEKNPIKFSEVSKEFLSLVDYSIPEDSTGTLASTVIKYFGGGKVEYLRKGNVEIDN